MNGRRMFGIETEYAVIGRDRAGAVVPPQTVAGQLLHHASTHLPNAPALDAGIFLQNGSRLYVDAGYHPEYSSPECCNPWDVVRYAKAGDLIMQRLSEGVCRANGASRRFWSSRETWTTAVPKPRGAATSRTCTAQSRSHPATSDSTSRVSRDLHGRGRVQSAFRRSRVHAVAQVLTTLLKSYPMSRRARGGSSTRETSRSVAPDTVVNI